MKFDVLASIAHNLAYSLASGASALFNFWDQHVYRDAAYSPQGRIEVDFIAGCVTAGEPSEQLQSVVKMGPDALRSLCQRHSVDPQEFRQLTASYTLSDGEPQFAVTVEDKRGRARTDRYSGSWGKGLPKQA
jgi:hypothetical protein